MDDFICIEGCVLEGHYCGKQIGLTLTGKINCRGKRGDKWDEWRAREYG
jgi:hypothetical protein